MGAARRFPELAVWLVADTVLVIIAGTGVAEDILNYAPDPVAGVGIALAAWVARTDSRRSSPDGPWPVRRELLVGLVAMLVAAAIVVPQVIAHDGDVSPPAPRRALLGVAALRRADFDDPPLTQDYGHDGQQFYVLAATFPHAHDAIPYVDRIRYRVRRVLFPALVSPARPVRHWCGPCSR